MLATTMVVDVAPMTTYGLPLVAPLLVISLLTGGAPPYGWLLVTSLLAGGALTGTEGCVAAPAAGVLVSC